MEIERYLAELNVMSYNYMNFYKKRFNNEAYERNLKEFIRLRDDKPQFEGRKQWGMVGVPCLVTKTGQYTKKEVFCKT